MLFTNLFITSVILLIKKFTNPKKSSPAIALALLLLLSAFGYISRVSALTFKTNNSLTDYWPTTEWRTSTPETQGMNSTKLNQMIEFIEEQSFVIDSVVVVRNGYIVLEEYPILDYNQDTRHILYSATKSVTSSLIGIAIQEGFIDSVNHKVMDLYPERTVANLDARKQRMTLEHLLTMTTGLEWDEWTYPYMDSQGNADSRNTYIQMIYSGDSIQFVLDRPMVHEPGTIWVYNSGASHLLAAIIRQITGYSTLNFAQEFLFGPLGISEVEWGQDPQGLYFGGHGLYLRPRDMAKFGYLYLNNGMWDDEQIVPAEWVEKSTETLFMREEYGYGYQWWTQPSSGIYFASGLYGQKIIVVPDYDIVVVFTATIKRGPNPEFNLLFNYVIPAVIGDTNITIVEFDNLSLSVVIAVVVSFVLAVPAVLIVKKKRI